MAVARELEPEWVWGGWLTLRRWRGTWHRWTDGLWRELDEAELRSELYQRTEHATYLHVDGRDKSTEERAWAPNKGSIGQLIEAVEANTILPADIEPGTWLDERRSGRVTPVENGLVDLSTRELLPTTPAYFNTSRCGFRYDPNAPEPTRWLDFLASIWPDDQQAIDTLQEIVGYILSGRRDLQKIFLVVGPTRSGKGTISNVIAALTGEAHVAGPTLAGLTMPFGLSQLIGKSLAIIPDARMPREVGQVVEHLLMISGGDRITVDRKHKDPWIGQLSAQIMMLSNELPSLPDAAAAIAGRLLVLRMTRSFYGQEDTNLGRDLRAELAGIFRWALDGLDRLAERGRFTEPDSSQEAVELIRESVSPIGMFLDERCQMEPEATVKVADLYNEWVDWCRQQGRAHVGTAATFGRQLFAAPGATSLRRSKPIDAFGDRVPTYEGIRLKDAAARRSAWKPLDG
jgi:putative DNA primase/helicase